MPGPLPKPDDARRRRNAPTIPTTNLPVAGRTDPAPDPPAWVTLGEAGRAWWEWAWTTPQACGWDDGCLVVVARRASLEDDLAAILVVPELNVAELLEVEKSERTAELQWLIRRLHSLAAGKLAISKEAGALEDRLGLNAKALAALRWSIVGEEEAKKKPARRGASIAKLRVVDSAVAGA